MPRQRLVFGTAEYFHCSDVQERANSECEIMNVRHRMRKEVMTSGASKLPPPPPANCLDLSCEPIGWFDQHELVHRLPSALILLSVREILALLEGFDIRSPANSKTQAASMPQLPYSCSGLKCCALIARARTTSGAQHKRHDNHGCAPIRAVGHMTSAKQSQSKPSIEPDAQQAALLTALVSRHIQRFCGRSHKLVFDDARRT